MLANRHGTHRVETYDRSGRNDNARARFPRAIDQIHVFEQCSNGQWHQHRAAIDRRHRDVAEDRCRRAVDNDVGPLGEGTSRFDHLWRMVEIADCSFRLLPITRGDGCQACIFDGAIVEIARDPEADDTQPGNGHALPHCRTPAVAHAVFLSAKICAVRRIVPPDVCFRKCARLLSHARNLCQNWLFSGSHVRG